VPDLRDGICPGCGHGEVIEAGVQPPLAVTHERVSLFGIAGVQLGRPLGALRLYACRGCGLAQWFADDPGSIPIGDEHGTRLVPPKPGSPYR
jgi:hypothetical protein